MSNLSEQIQDLIWTELKRQAEEVRCGPWVDRHHEIIDGPVDMEDVADAVIKGLKDKGVSLIETRLLMEWQL